MIKLKKGDLVDIVAPAGFSDATVLLKAVSEIEKWGLRARTFIDFSAFHPYHSDEDDIRFNDLKFALTNSDSKAIWCLRGGYGSARLLPALLKMQKPKMEKLLIGYSDITSLHIFFSQKWKMKSIHGPTISSFSVKNLKKENLKEIKNLLMDSKFKQNFSLEPINDAAINLKKKLVAPIAGGNLAIIESLIGTKCSPNFNGKILLLEDVNEPAYKIDRMLFHLESAGTFKGVEAIIFGDFGKNTDPKTESYEEFALYRFSMDKKIPIFKTNEFGHGEINRPLVLGHSYKIKDCVLSY